MRPNGPISV
ncbi:hypothetical protein YPPY11_4344, partial [Yersinia pestis PY-11]